MVEAAEASIEVYIDYESRWSLGGVRTASIEYRKT